MILNVSHGISSAIKKNATKCCGLDNRGGIFGPDTAGNGPLKSEAKRQILLSKKISLLQEKSPAGKGMVSAMGTRVRSAVTGQFVPKSEAVKHPKITVTEKVKSVSK